MQRDDRVVSAQHSENWKTLKSIFAIYIMSDNVCEAKKRIKELVCKRVGRDFVNWAIVNRILNKNLLCGDSLKIQAIWEFEEKMKGENDDSKR